MVLFVVVVFVETDAEIVFAGSGSWSGRGVVAGDATGTLADFATVVVVAGVAEASAEIAFVGSVSRVVVVAGIEAAADDEAENFVGFV